MQPNNEGKCKLFLILSVLFTLGSSLAFGIYLLSTRHVRGLLEEIDIQTKNHHSFPHSVETILYFSYYLLEFLFIFWYSSLADILGILLSLRPKANFLSDFTSIIPFLNFTLLVDYEYCCIRLTLEFFGVVSIMYLTDHIKPLHSTMYDLNDLLENEVATKRCCCIWHCVRNCFNAYRRSSSDLVTNPNQAKRIAMLKLTILVKTVVDFGFGIYNFCSIYHLANVPFIHQAAHHGILFLVLSISNKMLIWALASAMYCFIAIIGLEALIKERYRLLRNFFLVLLSYCPVIFLLMNEIDSSAGWIAFSMLSMVAFGFYIITCLLRILFEIDDGKTYMNCKVFAIIWQLLNTIIPSLALIFVLSYVFLFIEKQPALAIGIFVNIGFFIIYYSMIFYATIAENYELLDKYIVPPKLVSY